MMHAVLSNSRHPEYGQLTVPFPIPRGAYDDTVAALASLGIGDPVGRDCRVDELNSSFLILKRLEKVAVNVDELDYLAKRLDSSDINEAAKFLLVSAGQDHHRLFRFGGHWPPALYAPERRELQH